MTDEQLVQELLNLLDGGKGDKPCHCQPCGSGRSNCIDPLSDTQLSHSLVRFNDTSSQNVSASQQQFIQQQAAQFAQLMSITADVTTGKPKA